MDTGSRERRWQLALLPPHCCLCGLPADDDRDLCRSCAADLPAPDCVCRRCGETLPEDALPWPCGRCQRRPPPWQALQARCCWSPPAATIVHRLKFGGHTECARIMAELMIEVPPPFLTPDAVLVPVPLHWRRRWRRGFDQAGLLAAELARLSGRPLLERALRRCRATAAQSGLPARRRRRALRGAFRTGGAPMPECVILVDDVATTGATLAAAAETARRAGAERVDAWLFARSVTTTGGPAGST